MKIRYPAALFLTLISVFAVSPLAGQALEGRLAPHQLSNVRQAVLGGRLPPADVWPQPTPANPEAQVSLTSTVRLNVGGALRTDESEFWDSALLRINSNRDISQWTVHGEELGHWGFLFGAGFSNDASGWQATTLVVPREGNIAPIERHFMKASWLWYDFRPLQIEIGRDQIHWGPLDHSLIVGDQIPFLDMVRGTLDAGPVTLDWVISTPETRTGGGSSDVTDSALMSLHRVAFNSSNWRFALSERYIVHRTTGGITMADIFPVGSYHQSDIDPNNNCLYVDGEWVPAPGWRLMGQYGLDDVDGSLLGVPDYSIPTIWAFLVGAEWQGTLGDDPLRLYAEVGGTHYLWDDYADPVAAAVYRRVLNSRTETMDLSSPYGPGTYWVNLSARWSRGPVSVTALLEVFDTKEGVDQLEPGEEDYTYHWNLEGFGASPSERLTVTARWSFGPGMALVVAPTQTYHRGEWAFEGRSSLEWTL